jgi:hypothetical protein
LSTFQHSGILPTMNRGKVIRIGLVGLSVSAFRSAEAAQVLGEKTGAFTAFRADHPLLMIFAHIGAILLVLGFFAIVLAGFTRRPGDL